MSNTRPALLSPLAFALITPVFVLFWSTGFVAAKFGLPHAEPLTFLGTRFAIVTVFLLVLCRAFRTTWPRRLSDYGHVAVAGLLFQSGYLISIYYGIDLGVSIGVMALIAGLQPLITGALAGPVLGESVSRRQWLGLALGFGGLAMVVAEKVVLGEAVWLGYVLGLMALVAITLGTLWHKRFCSGLDLLATVTIQSAISCVLMLALAGLFESMEVAWTTEYLFALGWSAVVLSVIAIMLFYYLVARGAATRATSLIYLSPPTTAVMGWLVFDETLAALALAGMAVAVAGVAMVSSQRGP